MAGGKAKSELAPTGQRIAGLMKVKDGRWRVLLPGGNEKRFTETDENRAIAKARQPLDLDRVDLTTVETTLGEVIDVKGGALPLPGDRWPK